MSVSTKPPSGMRDFLPADVARRRFVTDIVQSIYARYGFVPLETPAIEHLNVLLGKYGEDEKLIYRLLHRGDTLKRALAAGAAEADALSDQALRYDLTVPLARVVAQYAELPRIFKRYQIQPVWRADRPGKGRFREFYQCDVDITGTTSLLAEAEVCGAACEVLSTLGFEQFTLWLNHRGLLRALIVHAGIDPAHEGTALQAVDKLDKIGEDGVRDELCDRGLTRASADALLDLVTREPAALAQALREGAGAGALAEVHTLLELLEATPAAGRAVLRPRLARGLGYYTGPIFELAVEDLGSSIGGGGRYDNLVGMFGKASIPAVGFSLGLERILVVMEARGMYPDLRIGPDVLLCGLDVGAADKLRAAHVMRKQGVRVEVFADEAKLGKQLSYAQTVGAAFAGILGASELRTQTITLKHLASATQSQVAWTEVAGALAGMRG